MFLFIGISYARYPRQRNALASEIAMYHVKGTHYEIKCGWGV